MHRDGHQRRRWVRQLRRLASDLSNPDNGISPVDPRVAGGDPYDLKDVGLTQAKYVRIVDTGVDYTPETCPAGSTSETNGFDLDAVSIVNALYE